VKYVIGRAFYMQNCVQMIVCTGTPPLKNTLQLLAQFQVEMIEIVSPMPMGARAGEFWTSKIENPGSVAAW
jgi:hypothetical protein